MGRKLTYILVCHWHAYSLYQKENNTLTLLSAQSHWQPLLEILKEKKATHVTLLDHSAGHIVKVEQTPRALKLFESFQWYLQKKRLVQQQFSFFFTRFFIKSQRVLIAGTNESLVPLKEKLESDGLSFSIISYPLELSHLIYQRYHESLKLSCPLFIVINRFNHMIFSFFIDKKISFMRLCHSSLDQQFKNTVFDTLKYLENKTPEKISLVFCNEGPGDRLNIKESFPQALFLNADKLNELFALPVETAQSESMFDHALALLPSYRYGLVSSKDSFVKTWAKPLLALFKGISMVILLGTVYMGYGSIRLARENHALSGKLKILQTQLGALHHELQSLPLSSAQMTLLQTLVQKTQRQQKKLWHFLDLLGYILGHRYALVSLSVGPKKARLVIRAVEKDALFDDFLDLWQQTLTEFHWLHPPESQGQVLLLESPSPFVFDAE